MAGTLALELNDIKDISLSENSTNIVNGISDAFSNAVFKGFDKIELPGDLGEKVKEGLEKIDLKEIGGELTKEALKIGLKKVGINSTTFNNISDVFEAVKEGDIKKGISSGINLVIDFLKLPKSAKELIKDGKNIIIEKTFDDELKKVMKKQQNTISRIDKKVKQMEEAFVINDQKTLDKVSKSLKTDLDKVFPIKDVIDKGNGMLSKYELYKSKGGEPLTSEEFELCDKLAVI